MSDCSKHKPELPYVGRFSPSPTGHLHMGSLFTAIVSWIHARQHNGEWLVRMEDLDPPREEAGAAEAILTCLKAWGLHSDRPVRYQSQRLEAYHAAANQLLKEKKAYRCYCSRKTIATAGLSSPEGWRYNGHCRNHQNRDHAQQHSIRLNTAGHPVTFNDELQGFQCENPETLYGDFPIIRADGFVAYQLAVVLDDAEQGVTHIVRGIDLLSSTSRQIRLQQHLNLPTPNYCHLPILSNSHQQKLSKQNKAPAVSAEYCADTMQRLLQCIGLSAKPALLKTGPDNALRWAAQHADLTQLAEKTELRPNAAGNYKPIKSSTIPQ